MRSHFSMSTAFWNASWNAFWNAHFGTCHFSRNTIRRQVLLECKFDKIIFRQKEHSATRIFDESNWCRWFISLLPQHLFWHLPETVKVNDDDHDWSWWLCEYCMTHIICSSEDSSLPISVNQVPFEFARFRIQFFDKKKRMFSERFELVWIKIVMFGIRHDFHKQNIYSTRSEPRMRATCLCITAISNRFESISNRSDFENCVFLPVFFGCRNWISSRFSEQNSLWDCVRIWSS
jgi:hypothetical protein